jgi:hypothetical protein
MRRVKIAGHTYVVEEIDMYGVAHSEDAGSVDNMALRILVNKTMAQSRREETFWHEAALEVPIYLMDMELGKTIFTHEHLSTLTEIQYQILKDNDGFWRRKTRK